MLVSCRMTLEPKTCVISVDASHSDFGLIQSAWMITFVSILSAPYFKEIYRKEMLESLEFIDYVFIVNDASAIPAIKTVKPDFYLKGEDQQVRPPCFV